MSKSDKINIGFFVFMFSFYLGVAIVSNAYLWVTIIALITIGMFYLQAVLTSRCKYTRYLRYFPFLFIVLFVFATETSRSYLADNPQSITVYMDEATNQERVIVEYGIYGFLVYEKLDRSRAVVQLNVTSSGYELSEPLNPRLEVFGWTYMFLGIPLGLNAVISFLNQTRSSDKHNIKTGRENIFKVIMASGDRFGSHNPKNAHIQQHQSFIQEKAKNEMIQDDFDRRVVHDEQPSKKRNKKN